MRSLKISAFSFVLLSTVFVSVAAFLPNTVGALKSRGGCFGYDCETPEVDNLDRCYHFHECNPEPIVEPAPVVPVVPVNPSVSNDWYTITYTRRTTYPFNVDHFNISSHIVGIQCDVPQPINSPSSYPYDRIQNVHLSYNRSYIVGSNSAPNPYSVYCYIGAESRGLTLNW